MGGNGRLDFPATPELCLEEQHVWRKRWGTDVCDKCGIVYIPPVFIRDPLPPLDFSLNTQGGLARYRKYLKDAFAFDKKRRDER